MAVAKNNAYSVLSTGFTTSRSSTRRSPQSGLTDVLQRDVPKWGKAVRDSGAVAE
jgi:hypothetical protein